jgi:hypothetical protein
MITNDGLRNPKLVVPTQVAFVSSTGYFAISLASCLACFLYDLLVVAYLLVEHAANKKIKVKAVRSL